MTNETDAEMIARLEQERDNAMTRSIGHDRAGRPLAALVSLQNAKAIRAQLWATKWGAKQADRLVVEALIEEGYDAK